MEQYLVWNTADLRSAAIVEAAGNRDAARAYIQLQRNRNAVQSVATDVKELRVIALDRVKRFSVDIPDPDVTALDPE